MVVIIFLDNLILGQFLLYKKVTKGVSQRSCVWHAHCSSSHHTSRVYLPQLKLGMMMNTCNTSTREVGAEASGANGHPWRHSDLKASLGYERPCLKQTKNFHYNY